MSKKFFEVIKNICRNTNLARMAPVIKDAGMLEKIGETFFRKPLYQEWLLSQYQSKLMK